MLEFILIAKDLCMLLFWLLCGSILLWFISHIMMSIIKTLFCDTQIKLYRTWCKRLKKYNNDVELEKVLNEIERQKKF